IEHPGADLGKGGRAVDVYGLMIVAQSDLPVKVDEQAAKESLFEFDPDLPAVKLVDRGKRIADGDAEWCLPGSQRDAEILVNAQGILQLKVSVAVEQVDMEAGPAEQLVADIRFRAPQAAGPVHGHLAAHQLGEGDELSDLIASNGIHEGASQDRVAVG